MPKIRYIHVTANTPEHLRVGFTEVYKEAFGGHPYFETYTDEEVLSDVWLPHLAKGIIILALDNERVIGLGCAKPVSEAPKEDCLFLQERRDDGSLKTSLESMWYMSEMAVLNEYRRKGIGYQLVSERLKQIIVRGGDQYSFRTAEIGSNSARLYRNIGATQLPGTIDVSNTGQVQINKSQSQNRIFFYGLCDETIRTIEAMV